MADKKAAGLFSVKFIIAVLFLDILIIALTTWTPNKIQNDMGPSSRIEEAELQQKPEVMQVLPVPQESPSLWGPMVQMDPHVKQMPDYETLKINESGQIIIVMFHKFVEKFISTPADKGEYTTTFPEFEMLLETLYTKGYRLISMNDFLNNHIDVPPGYTPIIFTFDDGSYGQFHFEEKDGKLLAADKTAVGILEKFNKKHPDFGLKGVFYVNLGLGTFGDKGTLKDKIQYLIYRGFEIGSHTYSHVNLGTANPDTIQKEMGKNVKALIDVTGFYKADTLALPYGIKSDKYYKLLEKGKFEDIVYENRAIMLVGASPSYTPANMEFDPMKIPRVRANGIATAEGDLKWWLKVMDETPDIKYVSDGNPDTITVQKDMISKIDGKKLKEKRLNTY